MKVAALTLALASTALGQSLQQVLSNNTQLSMLANLSSPYLSTLSSATNITLLAPNNAAVSAFLNSSAAANLTQNQDAVQALLKYVALRYARNDSPN